jgi:hypothetical protein
VVLNVLFNPLEHRFSTAGLQQIFTGLKITTTKGLFVLETVDKN